MSYLLFVVLCFDIILNGVMLDLVLTSEEFLKTGQCLVYIDVISARCS